MSVFVRSAIRRWWRPEHCRLVQRQWAEAAAHLDQESGSLPDSNRLHFGLLLFCTRRRILFRTMSKYIRWFDELSMKDVPIVGGKNASLGEVGWMPHLWTEHALTAVNNMNRCIASSRNLVSAFLMVSIEEHFTIVKVRQHLTILCTICLATTFGHLEKDH